ncbi:MAG: biotin transporter BioY [Puniceicoccales bacterium]|jgi:biotin transport system substrate-specific component|nr:biotin transporter BioY [Puniceicoccales bacterium]
MKSDTKSMGGAHTKLVRICLESKLLREIFFPLVISLLIFGATWVKVPFYPVPFTLQTFAIPLLCFFCSRKHMLEGLLLFTAYRILQSGMGLLLTSGYIFGFFPMVYILTPGERNIFKWTMKMIVAEFLVLFFGMAVLAAFVGLNQAFRSGFLFFIPAEILKFTVILGLFKLLNLSKK